MDEVAEILDKTGLTKEEKEQVTRIENRLSTIARQGRAFGIHLFLSTQRPDANILSGQIKNNIGYRICGRADNGIVHDHSGQYGCQRQDSARRPRPFPHG